ncbi:MAG: hypothetical protein A2X57_09390 [Nitrospirae bacterium GWD2_57_8]|jgi:soluble lytic murein transglycosylase|nr:MAG: hypothetical protein A2X57_09390 [Nitrospirae bacterium GWD2_57_8]
MDGPEEGFTAAMNAFKAGDMEKARLASLQVLDQFPKTPWARRSLFLLGRVFIAQDKAGMAEAVMVRVAAEYPELADYGFYLLAEYHQSGGRPAEAAKHYRRISESYPDSFWLVQSRIKLGQSLFDAAVYSQAAEAFEYFLKTHPRSDSCPDMGVGLGRSLAAAGKPDQAARAYVDLYVRYPGSPTDEEVEKALAELKQKGAAVPELTAEEQYERAKNLVKAKQHEKALRSFELALERDPEHPRKADVLLRSGIALFHLGRRSEAAAALEGMANGSKAAPGSAEALKWLARSYSRLGKREEAVGSYLRLIANYPDHEFADEALYLVGNIYRDAREAKKALRFYDQLVADFPRSKFADSALWWKAWTYYTSGDYTRTIQTLDRLIALYPKSFLVYQARYWQGRSAERAGDTGKAAGHYRWVLDRAPYSYYGYRAAERLAGRDMPVQAAQAVATPAQETGIADSSAQEDPADFPDSDGPPVWTEEAVRALSSHPAFRKALELMYLDMKSEAAAELWALKDRVPRKQGMLLGLSKTFFELGDYHRSLLLVLRNYTRYLDGSAGDTPADFWLLAYPLGYWETIQSYAKQYDQDPFFVASIIRQESMFQIDALSPAGARGVMQVMPATGEWVAQMVRMKDYSHRKLLDSDTSIHIGTWYISYLMKRFKGDPLIVAASYNAGPAAVASWLEKNGKAFERDEFVESIPFTETRWYVKKVLQNYREYRRVYGASEKDSGMPRRGIEMHFRSIEQPVKSH